MIATLEAQAEPVVHATDDRHRTPQWQDIVVGAMVALAAGGPTILWAFRGGDLLTDDWAVAANVQMRGFWWTVGHMGWFAPARPLAGLLHAIYYTLFGSHPLPLLLLLAVLNATVALLLLKLSRRMLPARTAALVALIWAILPNRGSLRLWIVMLPVAVALVMLLAAGLLLIRAEPRLVAAGFLIALACLAYEAVVFLGIGAIAYRGWTAGRRRWGSSLVALALPLSAAALVFLRSPKRSDGLAPFSNVSELFAANFGIGIFGHGLVAAVMGTLVLALIGLAVARKTFPSFGPPRPHDRLILVGAVTLLLGALPFLATGFPFGTDGIFDRGNITIGFGLALILAGCGVGLVSGPQPRLAAGVLAFGMIWVMALNGVDVSDYGAAARDGRALVAALDRDLPAVPDSGVVVIPPLPNRGGVAMFILDGDLASRIWLNRRTPVPPAVRMAFEGERIGSGSEGHVYDRRISTMGAIGRHRP